MATQVQGRPGGSNPSATSVQHLGDGRANSPWRNMNQLQYHTFYATPPSGKWKLITRNTPVPFEVTYQTNRNGNVSIVGVTAYFARGYYPDKRMTGLKLLVMSAMQRYLPSQKISETWTMPSVLAYMDKP